MNRTLTILFVLGWAASVLAQAPGTDPKKPATGNELAALKAKHQQMLRDKAALDKIEIEGVPQRLKDVAKFRGVWRNQLMGVGLVTGLQGTGDTPRFLATNRAASNLLRQLKLDIGPGTLEGRNVALVMLNAELPPFAAPGQTVDIRVSSMGDCQSLRGGSLVFSTLGYGVNTDRVFVTASGEVSVGGISAGAGGNSQAKGITSSGTIPGGGIVQEAIPSQTVFNGKMYLDLDQDDYTTITRVEQKINEEFPGFMAKAMNSRTIELTLPKGTPETMAQAQIEALIVKVDQEARVVIDEKTGTIVVGANVKIGACMVSKGSISVRIEEVPIISQPNAFGAGETVVVPQQSVNIKEDRAQITTIKPNTTVGELARVLQELRLSADDIINILKALREQGALKARLISR